MKITYNQIIDTFRAFADAHTQISEFGTGDLWEIVQHNKLTDFSYPLLFMVDKPASLGDGEITLSFDLLVMDKAVEDFENEVKSDTLLTLLDCVAYFEKLYDDDWQFVTVQKSGTSERFTERFDDTVTGWTMTISLKMPLQYDECQIPYAGHTPSYPDCAVATITDSDGVTEFTVASGGTGTCTPVTSDINLRFHFDAGDSITDTATIDTFSAGVYTSIADDGASGTITVSVNGGGFVAFSTLNPLTLVNTDTIAFTRTVTTGAGHAQLTGTY